jgi:hypothetical protein
VGDELKARSILKQLHSEREKEQAEQPCNKAKVAEKKTRLGKRHAVEPSQHSLVLVRVWLNTVDASGSVQLLLTSILWT